MLFIPPQKRGCCGECTQGFGQLAPKLQQEQGRSAPCYGDGGGGSYLKLHPRTARLLQRPISAKNGAGQCNDACQGGGYGEIWNAAPFSYFDCFGFRAGVILLHQE